MKRIKILRVLHRASLIMGVVSSIILGIYAGIMWFKDMDTSLLEAILGGTLIFIILMLLEVLIHCYIAALLAFFEC